MIPVTSLYLWNQLCCFIAPGLVFMHGKTLYHRSRERFITLPRISLKCIFLMNLSVNKIICSLLKLSHCVTVKISIIYLICHFKKNLKCFSFINMLGKQYVYVIKLFIVVETLFSCFAWEWFVILTSNVSVSFFKSRGKHQHLCNAPSLQSWNSSSTIFNCTQFPEHIFNLKVALSSSKRKFLFALIKDL